MSRRRLSLITALKERIPAGSKVLVAVSGGRDSVALLHGLLQVQRLLGVVVEVCHIDHGFRESSAQDAAFVEQLCREASVECHTVRLPPKPPGENLEGWARQQRYANFARLLVERGLDLLVTAHNANDVAETLLMRLIANKELNTIEEFDPRRRCLRPLMDITREQIDEYVTKNGISYVEDPSNADTALVRNRIRHVLLPRLRSEFDPSSVWILAEQARALAEDCDALDEVAREVTIKIGSFEQGSFEWLKRFRSAVETLPAGLRWRVVSQIFTGVLGFSMGRSKAKSIEGAMLSQSGVIALGAGAQLICDRSNGVTIVTETRL